jgi:hypothetical protein
MSIRVALLILLCLSGVVKGLVACTNTTYAEYYFNWCLSDNECQENLHLFDDDKWTFTETFDNELLIPMNLTGNSTCDPVAEPFWRGLLRTVNLCYPNHFRDPSGVCILRPGRDEDPDADFRTGFSGALSPLILAALGAEFLWLAVKQLDAWKAVFSPINDDQEQQVHKKPKPQQQQQKPQQGNVNTPLPIAQGVIRFK